MNLKARGFTDFTKITLLVSGIYESMHSGKSINLTITTPVNVSSDLIISLLEHNQSLSKVVAPLTFIHKGCRIWRRNPNLPTTWSSVKTSILSFIISCFASTAETIITNNKLKHLVIQPLDGVYHVSDHSFWSRIGVPLICKKTILAKCIVHILKWDTAETSSKPSATSSPNSSSPESAR